MEKKYLAQQTIAWGAFLFSPWICATDRSQAGMVVAASAIAFLVDDGFYTLTQEPKGKLNRLKHFSVFGEIPFGVTLLGSLYGLGKINHDTHLEKTAIWGFESALWSGVSVNLFKHLVGRKRPYMTSNARSFLGPTGSSRALSFPSGHSVIAFSLATSMAQAFPTWKWGAYALAGLVGVARIEANMHWFSDVIMGGGMGYLITRFIWDRHQEGGSVIDIYPKMDRRHPGVAWRVALGS